MTRTPDAVLDAAAQSLAAALPARVVSRSLVDPAAVSRDDLLAGVVCLVARGGGSFANTRGREGQLGKVEAYAVGYLVLDEGATGEAVERAELALLQEILGWCSSPGNSRPLNAVLPVSWSQSTQLERPYGWVSVRLDVFM